MLPVNSGGHAACQNFLIENLRIYYPEPSSIPPSTWDIIERFWTLDLTYTDELLRNKYSVFGPKPRTPSCMHRSYLLSIDFKVDSITDRAAQLKLNPLYAILSGFEFGNTPGVGTFYDFFDRLRDFGSANLSIAGDGTPLVTSARERRRRACGCADNGIAGYGCDRHFSQPDCDIGWDSSRDCFYLGYSLFMMVAASSESDLPVFPLLNPASKHDSLGFLEACFRMKSGASKKNTKMTLPLAKTEFLFAKPGGK